MHANKQLVKRPENKVLPIFYFINFFKKDKKSKTYPANAFSKIYF